MDKRQIENISANTEEAIKRKTAYGLPDRPSESGMRADEIKKAFYAAITDKTDSILAEIKRIVNESNDVAGDIYKLIESQKKVDISQGTSNANKVLVTDENGEIKPNNIIPIGVCKCYTEADLNTGEYYFVFEFPNDDGSYTKVKFKKEDFSKLVDLNKEYDDVTKLMTTNTAQTIMANKTLADGIALRTTAGNLVYDDGNQNINMGNIRETMNLSGSSTRPAYWSPNPSNPSQSQYDAIALTKDVNNTSMCLKNGYKERYSLTQSMLTADTVLYSNNYGINSWVVIRVAVSKEGYLSLSLRNSNNHEIIGFARNFTTIDTGTFIIPFPVDTKIVVSSVSGLTLNWGDVTVVEAREV